MCLRRIFALFVTAVCFVVAAKIVVACNEAVCASIVSKCMLQKNCDCNKENGTCLRECSNCLKSLYTECCKCIDICPKYSGHSPLNKKSHIEVLSDPIPVLFEALTSEPDHNKRWVSYTFPMDFDIPRNFPTNNRLSYSRPNSVASRNEVNAIKSGIGTANCTVAYMSHCASWNQCKESCKSMGASSYRWFHDGCCECIGKTCINYGINESRCLHCSLEKNALEHDYDDYGQDDEDDFYHD